MSGQHFRSQKLPTMPSGSFRSGGGGGGGFGVSPKLIIAVVVSVVLLGGGAIVIVTVVSNVASVAGTASGMATARQRADQLRRQAFNDFQSQKYHDPRECELQMVMHLAQAATLPYGDEGTRALDLIAATTGRLHPAAERYYQSARQFHANGNVHPDRLRDRPSVVRQMTLIETLADANRELRQGWTTLPEQIRQDLTTAGINSTLTEQIVREVRDGLRLNVRPLFHDTYGRYCDSIARVLGHLDGYWGKWRFNEQLNRIEFEGQNALFNYEAMRLENEQIARTLVQRANDVYAGPM